MEKNQAARMALGSEIIDEMKYRASYEFMSI
jgi:hypothetical protein